MPYMSPARKELSQQIVALAKRQPDWDKADCEEWDQLNNRYDALKEIEEEDFAGPRALLGRDGGKIADREVRTSDTAAKLGAWLKHGVPKAKLSAAEERAADRMGTSGLIVNDIIIRPFNVGMSNFKNAWSTPSGPEGGYLTTDSFSDRIEIAMQDIGGIMRVAETITTTTGGDLRWPTADDRSSEGVQVGEAADVGENDSEPFAVQIWRDYKFSSGVLKVSYELLEDSELPLEPILARLLGEKLGRIQARKFTTGGGGSTPRGIVTAAAAGVTADNATVITFDDVISLIHSVDQSRRNLPGVGFMMNDAILQALKKMKSGDGQYLWQPSLVAGAPDRLMGYPFVTNSYMADTIESGAVTMLFGELSAYKVRRVNELRFRRLNERYSETDQVGFLALVRADGSLLDAGDGPVRKLTQP